MTKNKTFGVIHMSRSGGSQYKNGIEIIGYRLVSCEQWTNNPEVIKMKRNTISIEMIGNKSKS